MPIEIGTVEALFRYPVKSMRGEPLQAATLGVSGLDGDRRLALRRLDQTGATPFEENEWLGAGLAFGAAAGAPAVTVTKRDVRCVMVNIDPDEGRTTPEMLKAVVRANQNCAGVYGSVTRLGPLAVGQRVFLHR